ncbi:MAG: DEAD/DEAH box helicase, partial [Chloroflexi bacterium]|nr:DEAD/DEAH box helicase [Chloroflexota bacterium]
MHASSRALPLHAPTPGDLVQVRSRRWLVEDVVAAPMPGQPTLVQLAGADDDAQGQVLEVYWEYELDRRILQAEGWEQLAARGFDAPRQFAAFLHTLRWNCVTATDPSLFQAPFRAGITIDAYQMEPLRKALRLPRVTLLIADDTGLGKTIEAGLIARELLLRKKVRTIVVAAPPSVLEQWKAELEERFGLVFELLDRAYLARMRRERGFGVNPWRTHSRFLVSHRLLIDPVYADPMREWLGSLLPGSLLILDEAHHAAPASGGRYGIESRFTRAVRDLAGRFEHRLFLSATPHNGHSNSFATLLELLDPYRFTRGVAVRGKDARKSLDDVMVRRLKEDIRAVQGGFPQRVVRRIDIDGLPDDAPELVLSRLLDEYRTAREQRFAQAPARAQAAAGLLVVGLQQRLLSSIEAFARSLKVHRATVARQWGQGQAPAATSAAADERARHFTTAPDADDERAEWSAEMQDAEDATDVAVVTATAEAAAPPPHDAAAAACWRHEQDILDRMQAVAEQSRHLPDAKLRGLIDWLR